MGPEVSSTRLTGTTMAWPIEAHHAIGRRGIDFKTVARLLFAIASGVGSPLVKADPAAEGRAAAVAHPSLAPVRDIPGLPRVLLIGDSISMGYTLPTRAALAGIANVHRPPVNCGATPAGLKGIDAWLGADGWDVIHFNWGLHDLRYLPTGEQLSPPADYERNLQRLVARLMKTGAVLVFATTTPVRQDEHRKGKLLRRSGAERVYNEIAEKVMRESRVLIDDLCAFARPRLQEIQLPNDLHFTEAGYKVLAGQVAASIREALKQRITGK